MIFELEQFSNLNSKWSYLRGIYNPVTIVGITTMKPFKPWWLVGYLVPRRCSIGIEDRYQLVILLVREPSRFHGYSLSRFDRLSLPLLFPPLLIALLWLRDAKLSWKRCKIFHKTRTKMHRYGLHSNSCKTRQDASTVEEVMKPFVTGISGWSSNHPITLLSYYSNGDSMDIERIYDRNILFLFLILSRNI